MSNAQPDSTPNVDTSAASVGSRLAAHPRVHDVIMAAAAAARHHEGADPHAMSHAWLLTGPPGAGRSTTALAFAAALLCTTEGELGCGNCTACRTALAGTHADVVHVVPQELSIGVDFVRDRVVSAAATLPTVGRWRIVIFEDADRLTDAAANALLKTIEEPPEHTVIMMCAPSTDPEDFSQTLRSRCRHVYVPALSHEQIVDQLVAEGASSEHARLAAITSLRHIGRARKLVSTPAIQQRRAQAINLTGAIFEGSTGFHAVGALVKAAEKEASEGYAEADEQERARLENALGVGAKGKGTHKSLASSSGDLRELEKQQKKRQTRRLRDVLDLALVDLAGIYRDALVIQLDAQVVLTHPDFESLSRELAGRISEAGLIECQDAIAHYREMLNFNVTPQVAFDGLVGRLRLACNVS